MRFKKCPMCNGTGKQPNILNSVIYVKYKTSNGYCIINELTELTPKLSSIDNIPLNQYKIVNRDEHNNQCDNTDFRDRPRESQQEYFGID